MTSKIVTVSFGDKDDALWTHIEEEVGTPVTGRKIRDLLYKWMNTKREGIQHED